MRFAVHGPAGAVASPRFHGVPRRDVACCVHVSVASVTAGGAPERRLALAAAAVHVPARAAALRGVRGWYLLHPPGGLVLKAADVRGLTAMTRKPSCRPAFRQPGLPQVPLKNAAIAAAWSLIACCCTVTEPAASQGLSARASVSCRQRSAKPGVCPPPVRYSPSCSTHRFHTYRASEQCRSSIASCSAVGSRR